MKRVEFNNLVGVKSVKGVALEITAAANLISSYQQIMMNRFKFMEERRVNNVFKLKNVKVPYYKLFGKEHQFDEMFTVIDDIDKNSRDYNKLLKSYPDGRGQTILTIEDIYNKLQNNEFSKPELFEVKGYDKYITKDSIIKLEDREFKPKSMVLVIDEMNELMTQDDYRAVDTIKQCIGSIARLGRAASVHMVLAMQRASGNTISSDLKNNIQSFVLLGNFGSSESTLVFDKDISHLSKPIKGRAYMLDANKIVEVQTYWIKPHLDFVFDEDLRLTYDNPYFIEKKNHFKEEIDNSGWYEESDNQITKKEEINKEIIEEEIIDNIDEDESDYNFDNFDENEDIKDNIFIDKKEFEKPVGLKLNVKKVNSYEDKT